MEFIRWFDSLSLKDMAFVGGKNASLGQMIGHLKESSIVIPDGFAITADAYRHYIVYNNLAETIIAELSSLAPDESLEMVQKTGRAIRELILNGSMPDDLRAAIATAYEQLSAEYNQHQLAVAVRSSATAEDMPNASFAGQQDSFLHVQGVDDLIAACKRCFASLFNDRAIVYRQEQGFASESIALSIGVQKMVDASAAVSGVAFSIDTETGYKDAVIINAAYGLGESIVQGSVVPDEFWVHKPTLLQGFAPIIKKQLGSKELRSAYNHQKKQVVQEPIAHSEANRFSLTDDEILHLARMIIAIEDYYSALKGSWSPMDVEWAKDSIDGKIYIVQARPETVFSRRKIHALTQYQLQEQPGRPLCTGYSIGSQIVSGLARCIESIEEITAVKQGEIIVTRMTDPDWVPVMKRAAGIITTKGGRTCHAAIVARELSIAAIVGAQDALKNIKTGDMITLDCASSLDAAVYAGQLAFEKKVISLDDVPKLSVSVLVNCGDPNAAFGLSALPVAGVGLARMEFIIAGSLKIHPLAALSPSLIIDVKNREKMAALSHGYNSIKDFFVQRLAQSIGAIAAAFYPRPVTVRFSDFKSNEYRDLIGGDLFEPHEENPMLGWRGASRYYDSRYQPAFALECQAIKMVREIMGLKNVKIMVPFVRTIVEAEKVIGTMAKSGLNQGKDGLESVMMVEIPSNVILIEEFARYFDGFSIGSNDLTQMVLGVDRDSNEVAPLFDERDPAVMQMMAMAIAGAHKVDKPISICGQAPSDHPQLARELIALGIDALSLNTDAVIPFLLNYGQ